MLNKQKGTRREARVRRIFSAGGRTDEIIATYFGGGLTQAGNLVWHDGRLVKIDDSQAEHRT